MDIWKFLEKIFYHAIYSNFQAFTCAMNVGNSAFNYDESNLSNAIGFMFLSQVFAKIYPQYKMDICKSM